MFSTPCLNVVNAISCAIAEFTEGLVFCGFGCCFFKKKQPSKRPSNKGTKKDLKQKQKIVAMMLYHNRSVSLFEIILQANEVNAVLKYN